MSQLKDLLPYSQLYNGAVTCTLVRLCNTFCVTVANLASGKAKLHHRIFGIEPWMAGIATGIINCTASSWFSSYSTHII